MSDLQILCDELNALATQSETPMLRQKAEEAFNSRWTGVQVCAARVLAKWGGRRSVELLKPWVVKWILREDSAMWQIACNILAECIERQDSDWVLNTYLTIGYESVGRYALWRCIAKIRFAVVEERLVRESTSNNRIRRLATFWFLVGLKKPQTVRDLMKNFLDDPDPEILQETKWYIKAERIGDW